MVSLKALAVLSIIALQLMLVYPYISGPANALFSNIASSIGFPDDPSSHSDDYSYNTSSDSSDVYEYRMEVKMYRDRLYTMLENGLIPDSMVDEVTQFLNGLTDEVIDGLSYKDLEYVKEKLEYYLKVFGGYEDSDDYYKTLDVNTLKYKIYDKLGDVAEYRLKAELFGVDSALEKLSQAEQLLNQALNLINDTDVDDEAVKQAWQLYLEAKLLIESAEHEIEYLYDD